jgi:hypothetical protein
LRCRHWPSESFGRGYQDEVREMDELEMYKDEEDIVELQAYTNMSLLL